VRYGPGVDLAERKQPRDEELEELPPLDGGADEDAEGPAPDLDDEDLPEDAADPFDDKAGDPTQGDGSAELDLTGSEGGWLADAEEAEGLDIGDDELLSEQTDLLHDNEEPGTGDEDYGIGDDEGTADKDAGEEGPGDEDEELREEDLPRLDADEGGSPDDEDFVEEGFGEDEAALGVPWGSERYDRVGAPLDLGPVRAVACVPGGVVVAGLGLCRVDLEGGVDKLAATGLDRGDVTRVWALGTKVVVTTDEGGLFVSADHGATFAPAAAWRSLVRPDEAAAGIEVVVGGGELWARTAQGTLLFSADLGASFEIVDLGGFVAAVAVDVEGHLVALVRTMRGCELARGLRGALVHTALTGALLPAELAGKVLLAARGLDVALAPEGAPVSLSLDGGVSWARAQGTTSTTALAWSKSDGCLLVGLFDERNERAYLAHLSPRGDPHLVAEMAAAPPEVEGGIQALALDEARGIVWVAGGFGVAALATKGQA
jgi:hypothetical protein